MARSATEEAWLTVRRLHEKPRLFETARGRRRRLRKLFIHLVELREPHVAPALLSFVCYADRRVSGYAADAMHALVSACSARQLLELDELTRDWWWTDWPRPAVLALGAAGVSELATFGDISASLLGLASFSRNGYVREAAVNALDSIKSGRELPFILIRLNDWVPQVRHVALRAFWARLVPSSGEHLLRWFRLVERLASSRRYDHETTVHAVYDLLAQPKQRQAVVDALGGSDPVTRRASVRILLRCPDMTPSAAAGLVRTHRDAALRAFTVRTVCAHADRATLARVVQLYRHDRYAPVRAALLDAAWRLDPTAMPHLFMEALFDERPSLRARGRFALIQLGHSQGDLANLSRERVKSGAEPLAGAVATLGDLGSSADLALLQPLMCYQSVSVRRAAVRSAARLDPAGSADLVEVALGSEAPRVSREARRAMTSHPELYDAERIRGLLETAAPAHARRNALLVLNRHGKWDRLFHLLAAMPSCRQEEKEITIGFLENWVKEQNRSFATPSAEQVARIGDALSAGAHGLPPALVHQIEWTLAHLMAR